MKLKYEHFMVLRLLFECPAPLNIAALAEFAYKKGYHVLCKRQLLFRVLDQLETIECVKTAWHSTHGEVCWIITIVGIKLLREDHKT